MIFVIYFTFFIVGLALSGAVTKSLIILIFDIPITLKLEKRGLLIKNNIIRFYLFSLMLYVFVFLLASFIIVYMYSYQYIIVFIAGLVVPFFDSYINRSKISSFGEYVLKARKEYIEDNKKYFVPLLSKEAIIVISEL